MRLKDLREDNDLKQREIAKILHICQNTYGQYEREERQIPTDILKKICIYYNVSADYVLELIDIPKPLYKMRKNF